MDTTSTPDIIETAPEVLAGDNRAAWQDWLALNASRFLFYARQQTNSHADAEDIVQDAYIRLWKWSKGAEPPAIGVMYAAMRQSAIDAVRRSTRRTKREIVNHALHGKECWFDTHIDDQERATEVQKAVQALPPKLREAITLKIWGGLTLNEIGQSLSIPLNTAASRCRLALEQLRKTLSAQFV